MKAALRSPPHGGADRNCKSRDVASWSRVAPSRGRGSKLRAVDGLVVPAPSPPHGGADRNCIEACKRACRAVARPLALRDVAPSRGRGSKLSKISLRFALSEVAPSRGRGSKLDVIALGEDAAMSPPHGGADRNMARN